MTIQLTKREAQIHALRQRGMTYRRIAGYLGISIDRVRQLVHAAESKVFAGAVAAPDPIKYAGACRVCGGATDSPCRRCYGKRCRICKRPVYRDECYMPSGGERVLHTRCQYRAQPRPEYMPDPARHEFLPAMEYNHG